MLISVGLLGCRVGQSAEKYPPAKTPLGVEATLVLIHQMFSAELLAVRDSEIVVLHGKQVTLVPYSAIRRGTFAHQSVTITGQHPPTVASLARLRLLSRFPQGISPELERRLLAAYGQDSIIVAAQ